MHPQGEQGQHAKSTQSVCYKSLETTYKETIIGRTSFEAFFEFSVWPVTHLITCMGWDFEP